MTNAEANLSANRLRASKELREAAQIALNTALEDGQLDYQETQERARKAVRVTYQDEITTLLQDLSFPAHLPAATNTEFLAVLVAAKQQGVTNLRDYSVAAAPAAEVEEQSYGDPSQGESVSLAVFGGTTKKGAWVCSPNHTAFCAFGSVNIDLRAAQLTAATTTINVVANFGGVNIVVPENCRVKLQILPVFGSSEVRDSKKVTVDQRDLPPDAPVVVIRGYVAFGGIGVRRVPIR